jgi:phosphatidate cytidylyltransferase
MKRVLTALLLIPLVLVCNFYLPLLVTWAALVLVALLCLREYFALAEKLGFRPFQVAGYGVGAVLIFARGVPEGALLVLVALVLLLLTLLRDDFGGALGDVASTLFGVIYIAGPFALGRELHVMDPHWLFFVLVLNWVGDSAAFFFGKRFGRGKMAPTISPNKTWAGAVASVVLAVIVGTGYLHYFQPSGVAIWVAVLLSVWVNVAAQFGDLAESALKRGADVKDSGAMLPGHGGMLDRVDGLLFSLPACYLVVRFL